MKVIILENVELPNNCNECPVCDYECGCCLLLDKPASEYYKNKTKPDWCPMIREMEVTAE